MTRRFCVRTSALVVAAGIVLSGCASTGGVSDELAGTGIGAAVGCGIGALISGDARGCAIGAAAGAALGYAAVKISQYESRQVRSAKADQRIYGLAPAIDSPQVKIRKGVSSPKSVKAGQAVSFATDYSVALPAGKNDVKVAETFALAKDGDVVWKAPAKKASRSAGGYKADMTIDLPPDLPPGKYTVVHSVQAGKSYDERRSTFTVRS